MGTEIEKKFLLKNDQWRGLAEGVLYRQGYLNTAAGSTVRVRTAGDSGYLTIKGPSRNGTKLEFEYEIPLDEANEILNNLSVSAIVEKYRHKIPYGGFIWEVDEFLGENRGLIFAEIELEEVGQQFPLPPWIGEEVTNDPRYYNSNLSRTPYSRWKGSKSE